MSQLQPGYPAPMFRSQAVQSGEIVDFTLDDAFKTHHYLLLAFYPADFTFVCPEEILQFVERWSDFSSLQCSVVCCSTDSAYTHLAWLKASTSERGLGNPDKESIVLLSDRSHEISEAYGVLPEISGIAYRANFLIGPDRRIAQTTISDMPVGLFVDEALRMVKELREADSVAVGRSGLRGRSASSYSRPCLPEQPPRPPLQFLSSQAMLPQSPCQMQYQQQRQQPQYQQHQQLQYQHQSCQQGPPAECSLGGVQQTGFQCEPQPITLTKPVCSALAVEAASLEMQAAQLRVKDSEDRLAWMVSQTERLRLDAERLRSETERLKAESRRRQSEADRLQTCHTTCQAGGNATRSNFAGEDCSWSTPAVFGTHRLQQQQQHAPLPPPPPPPAPPPSHLRHVSCHSGSSHRPQSHVCRNSKSSVTSHFANGGHRL